MTTEDPAAGRGHRADQRRRTEARIRAAAAELFVASGYERTTIRAVAQDAGVDAGLVMHYFGSKQELVDQVNNRLEPLPALRRPTPATPLAVLRWMLPPPEAAQSLGERTIRYRTEMASAIPAPDATL